MIVYQLWIIFKTSLKFWSSYEKQVQDLYFFVQI